MKEGKNMKDNAQSKVTTKIDWTALDEHWAEQYKEDYGNLFGKNFVAIEYP